MATVLPFRGMRYNTERVGTDVSALVCPPVDAIPPARRKNLHDRHPHNFCRLVAPLQGGLTPRAQSAAWLSEGIVLRDAAPIFYAVRQSFTATVGGLDDRFTRVCLAAELEYDPHDACLLTPFEDPQTSLGSLSDGEGTRYLVEPALLSYQDPHRDIAPILQESVSRAPLLRLMDDDSVEHSLHPIADTDSIEAIHAFFRSRSLMVLDGSSWSSASRRLALLVDEEDPGLFPSPVHRVYRGPRNVDPVALLESLGDSFSVEHIPWSGADAASALLASCAEGHHAFALRWKDSDEIVLLLAPHGSVRNVSGSAAGSVPPDTTVLEQIVEERLRALDLDVSTLSVRDAHAAFDVLDRLDDGRFTVLTNPGGIASFRRTASTGGVVPPRSVVFLPRSCCGLVSLPTSHGV